MHDVMAAELKETALFQAVHEPDLGDLASQARRRRMEAGKLVFKEGEAADSLYVVLSGSVRIFTNDAAGNELMLGVKKAGEYFGEMMLDHRPRSASIMTLEPCEFAVIPREQFRTFLARHPQAAEQVILNLIRVARGMNDRVKDYVKSLGEAKAPDLPVVRRWLIAKRWVLAALLALALAQFYFMDVLLEIQSMPGLGVFPGR
jgi:CRP/FNR family cyclic AMP-dependent transcriptional regulator